MYTSNTEESRGESGNVRVINKHLIYLYKIISILTSFWMKSVPYKTTVKVQHINGIETCHSQEKVQYFIEHIENIFKFSGSHSFDYLQVDSGS